MSKVKVEISYDIFCIKKNEIKIITIIIIILAIIIVIITIIIIIVNKNVL